MNKNEIKKKISKAIDEKLNEFFDENDVWRFGAFGIQIKMRDGFVSQIEFNVKESIKI